jgi:hypothetical protein
MRISTAHFLLIVAWSVWPVSAQVNAGDNNGSGGTGIGSVCPPVNQDGTTLDEAVSKSGFLACLYPDGGTCVYDLSVRHDVEMWRAQLICFRGRLVNLRLGNIMSTQRRTGSCVDPSYHNKYPEFLSTQ